MTYKKDRTNYVVNNNKSNNNIHLELFKHNLWKVKYIQQMFKKSKKRIKTTYYPTLPKK